MSHISRLKTEITSKEFLFKTLKALNLTYEEGDFTLQGFSEAPVQVEIRVSLPLSLDIGFRRVGESYEIIADWNGVHGTSQKAFTSQVQQKYAYLVTCAKLEEQGFSLVSENNERGQLHLVLRRTV